MWWTSEQACARLKVQRKTLYTYVSRGWIRSQRGPGRTHRYASADVEALAVRAAEVGGHEAAAASAMRWGAPVLSSAITAIDPDGPFYRGRSALGLAERDTPLEQVAALLWQRPCDAVHLVLPPTPTTLPLPDAIGAALVLLQPSCPSEVLRSICVGVAWAQGSDPEAVLAAPSTAAALSSALQSDAPPHLDAALVLCADHELNASTFAARVAAGTGAPDHRCVLAAVAAWGGPRHGLRSDRVEQALDAGEPMSGTHPFYPSGDPRGEFLVHLAGQPAGYNTPDLDTGLVAYRRAFGLPRGAAAAIFVVGRCVGWLAHAAEQREQPMHRPRARYIGPAPA
jgi:citrate synthase